MRSIDAMRTHRAHAHVMLCNSEEIFRIIIRMPFAALRLLYTWFQRLYATWQCLEARLSYSNQVQLHLTLRKIASPSDEPAPS